MRSSKQTILVKAFFFFWHKLQRLVGMCVLGEMVTRPEAALFATGLNSNFESKFPAHVSETGAGANF